jgi:hypothetical protein
MTGPSLKPKMCKFVYAIHVYSNFYLIALGSCRDLGRASRVVHMDSRIHDVLLLAKPRSHYPDILYLMADQ